MTSDLKTAVGKINKIIKELSNYHVERDLEIRGLALALIAKLNVLLLGEPGVGKSRLVEDWSHHIFGANFFTWLISQFTVPDELAGPPSLKSLEEDKFERKTTGMLPEAHIAFLDEIWKGNSGVINFLLPILNERVFHNEGKAIPVPLLTLVAASNELPEEEDHLEAALDRFVIKFKVNTIQEKGNWLKMMDNFLNYNPDQERTKISIDEIKLLQKCVSEVEVPLGVKKTLLSLKASLERKNVYVSPRVVNQSLRAVQAAAILDGKNIADNEHLEVLRHTFWKEPEHEKIIYNEILSKISPDKQKLEECFAEAQEIHKKALDLKNDDESVRIAIQKAQHLKKIKEKLENIRQNIKEKNKSTALAEKYLKKVNDYMSFIYSDVIQGKMEAK